MEDAEFRRAWRAIKLADKETLAAIVAERCGVEVSPASMFDVLVKRLHEYKRQLLMVLGIVARYHRLLDDPSAHPAPRACLFGAKAAPGYAQAKLIIKLIHAVAEVVNDDPVTEGRLRVAFLPDFNVSLAERIYPAADLSEQISLAGKEASGTGNMKFALNGALTVGTLDGANIEIRELVGAENFFLFGLDAAEVRAVKERGHRPRDHVAADPELARVLDAIASGRFSGGDTALFRPIVDSLLHDDEYLLLADFASYLQAQDRVDAAWADTERWTTMSILNTARCGFFSSDRTMREYCADIWKVAPVTVD